MYFDLIKAAKEKPRPNLAFRFYELYVETGKEKYLLGAFRYALPVISVVLQKFSLVGQDWEDALSMSAVELYYGYLKRKYWTKITRPGNYYLALSQVAGSLIHDSLRSLMEKPVPDRFVLMPGVTHGSSEHPASVLAEIYKQEVQEYVRRRVPEIVRCRRKEREAIPVVMDHLFRGVPLRLKDHGGGKTSVGVRLNGSVEQHRLRLLIDRISLCCRRAMYELEEESSRFDGLSVKGVLKGKMRKWQPLSPN